MSSPIRVKQEEEPETQQQSDSNLSNVPSDDSETEDNICIDNLQQLDPKVASQSNFLVGCKIWYDARKSRASKVLRAKCGHVVSVYFEFKSMSYVYRVKSSSSSSADDSCEHNLYEDRLMYGINCPVTVTNPDTNESEDGVIVLPKLDVENDGKQQISYAVQFTTGRHVSVEFFVAADRIVYREVKDKQVVIKDGIEDEKETIITQGDAEMKESKVDANLEEKAAAATVSTQINQNKEFESISLDAGRWEPPTQEKTPKGEGRGGLERDASTPERKRSFGLEVSERPSKMAKLQRGKRNYSRNSGDGDKNSEGRSNIRNGGGRQNHFKKNCIIGTHANLTNPHEYGHCIFCPTGRNFQAERAKRLYESKEAPDWWMTAYEKHVLKKNPTQQQQEQQFQVQGVQIQPQQGTLYFLGTPSIQSPQAPSSTPSTVTAPH